MDTLKQLQEKGEKEFRKLKMRGYNMPEGEAFAVCADNTIWGEEDIINHIHQQTTLAFEAGKAEAIAMVLKEIEKSYHGYGSGDGYLIDRGFNIALDTLKTKLQTKE